MRVVWKDSGVVRTKKPIKYRGHYVSGHDNGWIIDIPGDNNIYRTHYNALNAIDKALGGYGQMGCGKRKKYGIEIIGKKDGETA